MSRPYSFRTAAISHFLFWGDLKKKKKKQPLDALEKCSIASRALTLAYGILISQDGSFSENEFDVSSFKSELIYCRIIFFFSPHLVLILICTPFFKIYRDWCLILTTFIIFVDLSHVLIFLFSFCNAFNALWNVSYMKRAIQIKMIARRSAYISILASRLVYFFSSARLTLIYAQFFFFFLALHYDTISEYT